MDALIKTLLEFIKTNWYKKRGLITLNIVVIVLSCIFFYQYDLGYIFSITHEEIKNRITPAEIILELFFLIITNLFWILNTSPPKNKKNKVGIIIAILTEHETEKIRLKNDFIKTFEEKIKTGKKEDSFKIIEYPEYYSSQITLENVSHFLNKSKAHFIIFGLLKKRHFKGEENYFFRLNIVVRHAPIPTDISKIFSKEMNLLSPRKVHFIVKNEFQGFEVTSDWAVYATEYIIGVASYLSGDFQFSSDLHFKLYNNLKNKDISLKAIRDLRDRNKVRLIEVLFKIQLYKYYQYRKSNNKDLLTQIFNGLKTIKSIDPKVVGPNICRAIIYFLRERDVDSAFRELRNIAYNPDNTWRYSEAFLYAYRGDMEKATRSYRKAFKGKVEMHVPEESEEFINDILRTEPDKYQLYFCLGLINFFAKEDFELAKKDFENFLNSGTENDFVEQRRLAREYIKQIKI